MTQADIGLIGLAVMGQNLVLNMADHGYKVAVYNRTTSVMTDFVTENPDTPGGLVPCESLTEFIASLKTPRKIVLLIKAGKAIDIVVESLLEAGLEPDDIVVDAGNSLWTDTIEREKNYADRLKFFGSGTSGGEEGARFGPSLMPGGNPDSWKHLEPIWKAIASKVDPETGQEIKGATPGHPISGGVPCTTYIGPNGAGHYVKMVHNGIEYGDMQMICEAYHLMRDALGMTPVQMSQVFAEWNRGQLNSFLIEITADILQQTDPETGKPFVDVVLDTAGQKGTGKWTAMNSIDMGIPASTIAEAVFARLVSAIKDERVAAGSKLRGPASTSYTGDKQSFIDAIRDALYCSKICSYAQGFALMREAEKEYDWTLNFGEIASIWRGGCIIRAQFLQSITDAYERDSKLANLLLDPYFAEQMQASQDNWRTVVASAATLGIPTPTFSSALAYFDSYRSGFLPANLLQAQRDYFGAHTYERIDKPRGQFFHIDWPESDRPQLVI
ncbi:MAG: NADP-dependent phosphogluconate dehydrogenase [Cyanobacteria bacterium P01_D01_bin.123]